MPGAVRIAPCFFLGATLCLAALCQSIACSVEPQRCTHTHTNHFRDRRWRSTVVAMRRAAVVRLDASPLAVTLFPLQHAFFFQHPPTFGVPTWPCAPRYCTIVRAAFAFVAHALTSFVALRGDGACVRPRCRGATLCREVSLAPSASVVDNFDGSNPRVLFFPLPLPLCSPPALTTRVCVACTLRSAGTTTWTPRLRRATGRRRRRRSCRCRTRR